MGWTFTHKPKGEGTLAFLRKEIEGETDLRAWKVLDGVVTLKAAYLAVERLDKTTGERTVYGLVCLLRYTQEHYNLGYKDMDETMHPYYYGCPERILSKLSPTDDPRALAWRDGCRRQAERKRLIKSLTPGTVLVFEQTFRWRVRYGEIEDSVLVVDGTKPLSFRPFSWDTTRVALHRDSLEGTPFKVFVNVDAYRASLGEPQKTRKAA
jgi:hypothetical protein